MPLIRRPFLAVTVALALLATLALGACSRPVFRDTGAPIEPVAEVDLERYAGRWYEIARFPVWFQEGCVGVTADYALRPDGRVDVLNTCREETLDGRERSASATARVVDEGGGRLKVRFLPWLPFIEGDYWIIHLEPDYSTAVVAIPSGTAGWILSREPAIAPERLAAAEAALQAAGYDLRWLQPTPQPPGGS
jgi:apolipoprotein D and lipocalin family protein